MKERLLNILDQSTCLTRRQMKDYLAGTMLPEEVHAAETHISSCPLCSMAMDGFEAHSEEALAAIGSLNSGFLKDHFDSISPQIHLNSMTPAVPVAHHGHHSKKKNRTISIWKVTAAAAALLVGFGFFRLLEKRNEQLASHAVIAQHDQTVSGKSTEILEKTDRAAPVERKPVAESRAMPASAAGNADAVRGADQLGSLQANEDKRQSETFDRSSQVSAKPIAPQQVPVELNSKEAEQVLPAAGATTADSYTTSGKGISANYSSYNSAASTPPQRFSVTPQRNLKYSFDTSVSIKKETKTAEKSRRYRDEEDASLRTVAAKATVSEKDNFTDREYLAKGDDLYDKGNVKSALNHYIAVMKSGTGKRKAEATVSAARCYLVLKNKGKAISLLRSVVKEGGPQHRTARRMLRDLGVEE